MATNELINALLAGHSVRENWLPEKERARRFVDDLFGFLFGDDNGTLPRVQLEVRLGELQGELRHLLHSGAEDASQRFFEALPAIYEMLLADARAILDSDPAAHSLEEVLAAYPGFYATFVHRTAHLLWRLDCRLLARFFAEHAHGRTGIDIHPAAQIGPSFAIDHGTGIVIGETTRIGSSVKIYQGVTLGALNVSKTEAAAKRHPTIGDGVVIYAGATILGGATVVGAGSIIGGNVWLTNSVPPNSVVYHKSEVHIKTQDPFPEPINFII